MAMTVNINLAPGDAGSVPRVAVPFAPPAKLGPRPPSSVPVVPPFPRVPAGVRLPVMAVEGVRPDRTGNVDLSPVLSRYAPLSHVYDLTVHHSASQIAGIAATEVARVVAGAPAAFDTLKEIADWIGSGQSGAIQAIAGKADRAEVEAALALKKDRQSPVSSPLPNGVDTMFIASITQDENGVISASKKNVALASPPFGGTSGKAGLMSAADKAKLDGIAAGANNYVLPAATASTLGGVKQGANVTIAADGTISASASVDVVPPSASATPGQAADAKATGTALYTGFTEWVCDEITSGWTFVSCEWKTVAQMGTGWFATSTNGVLDSLMLIGNDADATALVKEATATPNHPGMKLSRRLVTPTKTSQLTNDSGFLTQHQDISGKANVADVNAALALKADKATVIKAWDASAWSSYGIGDIVAYNGALYWIPDEEHFDYLDTASPDENGSAWEKISVSDSELAGKANAAALAAKLDSVAAAGAWHQDNYYPGDLVTYNGRLWRALNYTPSDATPEEASEDWAEVTVADLYNEALTVAQATQSGSSASMLVGYGVEQRRGASDGYNFGGVAVGGGLQLSGGTLAATATPEVLALKADKATTYTKSEIDSMFDDLSYTPIAVSSFSVSPSSVEVGGTVTSVEVGSAVTSVEVGSMVTSVTFSYALSKAAASATLDGSAVTLSGKTGTIPLPVSLTANKTWTLSVTDAGSSGNAPHTATKTATLSFLWKRYWGAAAEPASVDDEFLNSVLSGKLGSGRSWTFTVDAGTGQYIWYAVPKAWGACSFKVGGFDGGFQLVAETFGHVNESGGMCDYRIYRSDNAALGSTTVVVS